MATEPDKVDSGVLGTLTVVGVLVMIGTCLGVNALVRTELDQDTEVKSAEATAQLRGVMEKQVALLKSGTGIEQHMKAVVSDLRRNPTSASPPPPPPPAPPPVAPTPPVDADGAAAKGAELGTPSPDAKAPAADGKTARPAKAPPAGKAPKAPKAPQPATPPPSP